MKKEQEILFEEFASDAAGEDDYVEVPVSSATFFWASVAIAVIIGGLFGRLVYLNLGQKSFYVARAERNVNLERAIPAQRGTITDRYGEILAKNTETFSIFADAAALLKDRRLLSEVLGQLSDVVGVPVDDLEGAFRQGDYERLAEVPLVRNVSPEVAIAVRGLNLPSIVVANDLRREYIDGPIFSSVVGYTGAQATQATIVGKVGLERTYDDVLRGIDGLHIFSRDAKGAVLDDHIVQSAVSGKTVVTTIDAGLQRFFHKRLEEGLRSLGVYSGVGIAMDPKTGEVLALVSLPSYDNNIFVTPGKSQERAKLVNDSVRKPLFNRAVSGAYNPGSTIKPLVALAALHEKVIKPTDVIYSAGYIDVPNPYVPDKPTRFVEYNMNRYGWVDVRSALAKSSNVYFYTVGGGFGGIAGLGLEKLNYYWQKFGLGQKTGLGLEPEVAGFLPTAAEKEARTRQPWRLGDTFNVSIGQGDLLVSPIQLINHFASIADNGVMRRPQLIKEVGGEKVASSPVLLDYSDWKLELKEVQAGMRDGVVKEYGTSHILHTLPFSVAAKTGSAQTNNNTKTNAFFVGYAPYEDPRIVVSVLVENAKSGSLNAVPIAKDILQWYWDHRLDKQDTE